MTIHTPSSSTFACLVFAGALAAQSPAAPINPWSGWNGMHAVRSGDTVLAFGTVLTGSQQWFLHVSRSTDGGRTFPTAERTLAYLGDTIHGSIGGAAMDGEHAYVVVAFPWFGAFVLSSHDGGASWSAGTRVSTHTTTFFPVTPRLFAHGLDVSVVWTEARPNGNLWANHSGDGGATWLPQDQQLDIGLPAGGDAVAFTTADGAELHLYWVRTTVTGCQHQVSRDGGATWLPSPQALGTMVSPRGAGSADVQIVTDLTQTRCVRSLDHGASWQTTTIPGLPYVHAAAARGAVILAVGSMGQVPATNLLLQVSTDAGGTWLPVPYAVGWYRRATFLPVVTATMLGVDCVFDDTRTPPAAWIQSDDHGGSWRLVDGDADALVLGGEDGCIGIGHKPTFNGKYLAWAIAGHTLHGSGGGTVTLRGRGPAGLGRTFELAVAGAVAGAVGGCFATFDALTNQQIGDQWLFVSLPHLVVPFTADANGEAAHAVVVPFAPALVGLRLATQAFAIDPALPSGFVASNAIESWIQ